jgi:hypothetical protein
MCRRRSLEPVTQRVVFHPAAPRSAALPADGNSEVRLAARAGDDRPHLCIQLHTELDVDLVGLLREFSQLLDDCPARRADSVNGSSSVSLAFVMASVGRPPRVIARPPTSSASTNMEEPSSSWNSTSSVIVEIQKKYRSVSIARVKNSALGRPRRPSRRLSNQASDWKGELADVLSAGFDPVTRRERGL